MKTASQLLKECEELKQKLGSAGSPLNNNEVWSLQHQLQVVCGQLLIEFQDIALENLIERELWNVGFRNNINQLQAAAQAKKKENSEAKDVLNWFLNSASGFYLQLFNQICTANSLDLVFRRKDSFYGMLGGNLSGNCNVKLKSDTTKNALYLCQYCLVHLGDLARYRHHAKQAETFYRHAVTVSATSGHPYNQLALLEAGRGNRLAAVFLYIRSLGVTAPFTGAPSNLAQTLMKILGGRQKSELSSGEVKIGSLMRITKEDYINVFLHFHSSLLLKGDMGTAKEHFPRITSGLSTLVATTSLTRSSLIHMFTINLFSILYFSGRISLRIGDEFVTKKDEDLLVDPKESCDVIPLLDDVMVGMLAALLLPVHTMKEPEVAIMYIALPAICLILEWILMEEKILSPSLKKKQQIWPGLCTLVNFLQQPLLTFDSKTYAEVPLPEDWDLRGFQPLGKLLSRYRYRDSAPRLTPEEYGLLRAHRLTELAEKFSKEDLAGGALLKMTNGENGKVKFEAQGYQNPPVEEVLNLEMLTLHPPAEPKVAQNTKKKEKVGILKPQGSLERSKESKEPIRVQTILPKETRTQKDRKFDVSTGDGKVVTISGGTGAAAAAAYPIDGSVSSPHLSLSSSTSDSLHVPSARPKTRTNVALQAILKRNTATPEVKQVTFQAASPTTSPNPSDASSESQRSQLSTPPPLLPLVPPTPSLDLRPSSPLVAMPLGSTALKTSFNISNPPPIKGAGTGPPYRWRDVPPPPLHLGFSNPPPQQGLENLSLGYQRSSSWDNKHVPANTLLSSTRPPFHHLQPPPPTVTQMLKNPPLGGNPYNQQGPPFQRPPVNYLSPLAGGAPEQRPNNPASRSPAVNVPFLDNSMSPPSPRSDSNYPPSSNSLFTQGNYYPPNAGWLKDPPQRMLGGNYPPMMTRGNISSSTMPQPPPQYQQQPLLGGMTTSGLYSSSSPPQDQNSSQESSDNRRNNTYSLFGPLGGMNSPSPQLPPHLMFTSPPQQQQNLWSGPSPLERLLEQKKFSSNK